MKRVTGSRFDFAVLGSGFSGSIMSMILRRMGYTVLLVEKGVHPRFAIGESSTPLANLLLEKLADEYELPVLREFSKWGAWQKSHPEVGCGIKRGFTFFHHRSGERLDPFAADSQLMVAASPNDPVADTHWYRPEFDLFMVRAAAAEGVEYLGQTRVEKMVREKEWTIQLRRLDEKMEVRAGFVLDASGAASVLSSWAGLSEADFPDFPQTRTVYAHFRGVPRWGNELVNGAAAARWPYPPENAAVHHLFRGGWIWILHFNNGITSAGAMLTAGRAEEAGWGNLQAAEVWDRVLLEFPTLAEIFRGAEAVTPFYSCARVVFRKSRVAGDGFALLPSAAGFVDPLLSTGFALSLLGIRRLASAFRKAGSELKSRLAEYEDVTLEELDAAADLVSALYASLGRFDQFRDLTLLYFAALSFTESCWRLGREEAASSFLLCREPEFSTRRKTMCRAARAGEGVIRDAVLAAIDRYDVAGLTDRNRHPWYPARLEDLYEAREKIGVRRSEIDEMLECCGLRSGRALLR